MAAAVCGGIVGIERERSRRPAGLRTHVLVSVGSALIMQVSLSMWALTAHGLQGNGDPGRIAAQVVSGIGFLGAGTIMREGMTVRGLTTAASLWVVAGVGLAAGAGLYTEALVSTFLVVVTLKTLVHVERFFNSKSDAHTIIVHVTDTPGRLGALASVCSRWGANVVSVAVRPGSVPGTVEVNLDIKMAGRAKDTSGLISDIMATEGVVSVTEEE